MREFEPSPELSSPKNSERILQPLGSTALLFIPPPEVHVDPYETTIFMIEDEEDSAKKSDTAPSFAASREDYQLLRRHKQSMKNRRKRGGRRY